MSNKNVALGPLAIDLASICGCRFGLRAASLGTVVTVASRKTEIFRRLSDDAVVGLAYLEWLTAVCDAFAQPTEDPEDTVGSVWSAPDGSPLSAEARLLDGPGAVVRVVLTMLSDDGDSLDYCHVAVTLDLALTDLAAQVAVAAAGIAGGIA